MKNKIISIFITLFSFCYTYSNAQKMENLRISIQNENISFPFTRFNTINPGIELGTTMYRSKRKNSIRRINADLGFFHHKNISNGLYIKGSYEWGFDLSEKFEISASTGIGYLHTFYPGEIYKLNSKGEFEKTLSMGRPHAIASAGLRLFYKNSGSFEPFIASEFILESPFANGIPVFPHSIYKLGININLKSDEKN